MIERCDWKCLTETFDDLLMEELDRWQLGRMDIDLAGQFLGDSQRSTAILAREQDITTRQVERRVRRLTQTSPKRLACLSRFQKVRDAIWADPSIDLARLAVETGYSDQPHMTRHFRRYSGQTPASFARSSVERKKWLAAQDVAFVQDGAARDG
jgi:methylphosphotriester-DNA--protein-cysteine methyltransferase